MDKKITTMFLKKIRNDLTIAYTEDEENYYLTDGYIMFAVPKEEMELNIDKFKHSKGLREIVQSVDDNKYEVAKLKYFVQGEYGLIAKLSTTKVSAYIQDAYYNFFKDCEFRIKGSETPVACYRNGNFVGIVLPIRMNRRFE